MTLTKLLRFTFFPGLEMTILKFHDFSRFSMTVRTLSESSWKLWLPPVPVAAEDNNALMDLFIHMSEVARPLESHLLCFSQRYRGAVAGRQLDVLAEASLHQRAHPAKDPNVALQEKRAMRKIHLSAAFPSGR